MMGKGTFDELYDSGVDFSALLKREEKDEEEELKTSASKVELMRSLSRSSRHVNELGSTVSLESVNLDYEPDPVQLQEEEERREGTIGMGVYKHYFMAGANIIMLIILALINIIAQTAFVMSDWFLSYWANQEEARHAATQEHERLVNEGYNVTNVTIPLVDMPRNVYIFTGITFSVFLFGILRALLFFRIAITASKTLHNRMFDSILRTKISFFDTNPVGRILNRFSKDVGHMDDNLPITFFDFLQCFLLILGIVIVAGVVNPWVFIPIIPLSIAFVAIRHYYIKTSRNIKRLEGTTRSPVFSHLSASLLGLGTIRAFDVQEKFSQEFDDHQDLHTEAWFLFITSSRWLAVRLDWLCASFVSAVAFCSVLAADSLDAGLVGLSVTYAMTLMGMFQWAVRQSAEVENQMVSVERVLEYSNLPQEASLDSSPDNKPPPSWPHEGVIRGEQVGLRYGPDAPLVLKNINFVIQAKEKVGIVGRTGAGKSSLLTVLFRLVEPEGKVTIDGINISKIGLHDLRNKISIIPQDPTLFTGSVRVNLDPFEQHSDEVLWSALEEVQLKPVIDDLPGGLEWNVSEGGINFSVGQRQLICLARAILRKNKILVIDEATANVDPRTDDLIQETIREKFAECTVLTIAHRLHTIMDSDRVLVLDDGCILAFDEPYTLLQDKIGHFYKMVEQTGRAETDNLTAMALAAQKLKAKKQQGETVSKNAENGIKVPVILKLNDQDLAPMASPESTTLGRRPRKPAYPVSALAETPDSTSQNSFTIPDTAVVANDNRSSPEVDKDEEVEHGDHSERDKLLETGTATI
ncbi:LOW QUALITY PROTEIN: ATP-binding cassette sub-family C member 4-like [Liolophura sinensis]|uniref:LOW QUALITY PROTEIN: ATP-binding cassette sub-family C member 4-like n=1 Tax=Liolophura sinensis TaxID=3198878 RepID=UPI0031581C29